MDIKDINKKVHNTPENTIEEINIIKNKLENKSEIGHTHDASEIEGISTDAKTTSFDNSSNGMTATNVQSAIDENKVSIGVVKTDIQNVQAKVTENTSSIETVKGSVQNIESEIEDLKSNVDSAKEGIVGAIGDDEINDNSTFEEIKNHLANTKNELVNQLTDKGVTVENSEGLLDIVDRVSSIQVEKHTNLPSWLEVKDLWVKVADIPTPRENLTASSVGNKIYVIGGSINKEATGLTKINECYDTITNTWAIKTGTLAFVRGYLSSCTVDEKIYAIGGRSDAFSYVGSNECYDTITDTWTTKLGMPTLREKLVVSSVGTKVYAIGGSVSPSSGGYVSTHECYDTLTNTWTTKSAFLGGRERMISSSISNKIYVIGGYSGEGIISKNECYDTTTNTWTTKANMPTARNFMTSAALDGKIYVIGGNIYSDSTRDGLINTNECYDVETNTWRQVAGLRAERDRMTSSVVGNYIYVMGGGSSIRYTNLVECYIP